MPNMKAIVMSAIGCCWIAGGPVWADETGKIPATDAGRPTYVALVLDCSTSMKGKKAAAMKEGAKLAVAMLESSQELILIDFNSTARSKRFGLKTAMERAAAMRHIDQLQIVGGTNYVAALEAEKLPEQTPILFLSDGEHGGLPADVLKAIEGKKLGPVHTIAIEAPAAAGKLLSDMAVRSGGSFLSVDNSEALVQAFLDQARYLGEYRVYHPSQDAVKLARVTGKVLAIGFDAVPVFPSTTGKWPLSRHHATLPGGQISLAVLDLAKPTALNVKLGLKRTAQAHMAILRQDLARATTKLSIPGGYAATGGTVQATIKFTTPEGKPIDPRDPANKQSAKVVVKEGRSGKVMATIPAGPSPNQPALQATIKLPAKPGPVTIETITTDASQGPSFIAQQKQTIQVQKPFRLVAKPARLQIEAREGSFNAEVKLAIPDAPNLKTHYTARLDGQPVKLRLLASETMADTLKLKFDAAIAGTYRGVLLIDTITTAAVEPLRLPYEFTITEAFLGLDLPSMRRLSAGSILANSGEKKISLDFPSRDPIGAEMTVQVEDLASGTSVIPLAADAATIRPCKGKPARVTLTTNVGNVPAGEYAATVTVKLPRGGKARVWESKLTLTVTEPLSVQPLDFGKVEVGQVSKQNLVIRNAAGSLSNLSISRSKIAAKGGDIVVTVPEKVANVAGKAATMIPVSIVVSPLVTSRGVHKGMVRLRRAGTDISIPIAVTVVGPGEGPSGLLVAPRAIELKTEAGQVAQFTVRIKFAADAIRAEDQVSGSVGAFVGPDGKPLPLDVAFKYPGGGTLKRGSAVIAMGFLIAPERRGRYTATLTVTSQKSGNTTVPVQLIVE